MSVAIRQVELCRDLLDLHEANPERYPYLLESVAGGTPQSRFDILFAFPGSAIVLGHDGTLNPDNGSGDFLDALDGWWERERAPGMARELPFTGGWFLFLGYELAGQVEPALDLPAAPGRFPTAFARRCPAAIIRDHQSGCTWLVAEDSHAECLRRMDRDLGAVPPGARERAWCGGLQEEPGEQYRQWVRRILAYIGAGDVFQVNIARRWTGSLEGSRRHTDLYRGLREHNPAPFAGLARWGEATVLSSSPERLVQVRSGVVQTRPIAGTRPRDAHREQDEAYSRELLAHPKERAEHIMLIDLERNDLGRVCVPGSVEVSELMVLESYAHVHHIVSNVRGRLRPHVTPGKVIRAVFPGGTITGCPKVRCMEIIAELEGRGRGPYTGSMGYLNRDGGMDLNILIRSLLLDDVSLELMAGAGIVADSDPERELAETRAKARGLLLAMEAPGP